ncbi:hypothetical protein KFK09_024552 [Dendrobium nobile]|uniref:Uncharacterized protein n=1 Tax=Dendrobium nobile TaxID=94219 RepID=A0A8T3AE53_DENNO|nr:hypothetical protein KFK09_024552 [Dendrobium nobile]
MTLSIKMRCLLKNFRFQKLRFSLIFVSSQNNFIKCFLIALESFYRKLIYFMMKFQVPKIMALHNHENFLVSWFQINLGRFLYARIRDFAQKVIFLIFNLG